MTVCKSIRDKIAFRFIRFGFRIALKNKTKFEYLQYMFKDDTYTFKSKERRDLEILFKTDDERLKSPSDMQIEVSEKLENTIKAESAKEFAERLKNAVNPISIGENYKIAVINWNGIDNLVKEMVGDADV